MVMPSTSRLCPFRNSPIPAQRASKHTHTQQDRRELLCAKRTGERSVLAAKFGVCFLCGIDGVIFSAVAVRLRAAVRIVYIDDKVFIMMYRAKQKDEINTMSSMRNARCVFVYIYAMGAPNCV